MTGVLARSRTCRVVVVDDTADLRDLLGLALSRGPFEIVGEADNGQSGIDVVEQQRPDLVLLDLSMPVMDGLEALPVIRVLVPHALVVVLSSFGAPQMATRALAAGADGYVQKGAPLPAVVSYLERLVTDPESVPAILPLHAATALPPGEPTPRRFEGGSEADAWPATSARAAHELAPHGVVEVADDDGLRILYANPAACSLLGSRTRRGLGLAAVSTRLAGQVADRRERLPRPDGPRDDRDGSGPVVVEVELTDRPTGPRRVQVAVAHTGWSVLLYVQALDAEVLAVRGAMADAARALRGPVGVLRDLAAAGATPVGTADGAAEPDATAETARTVAGQARVLDAVTADLLAAVQVRRGLPRPAARAVPLADVVAAVRRERPEVAVTLDEQRPVLADPAHLDLVLRDLLANARTHGAPPFALTVRADPEDVGVVCLDVVDHGAGLPAPDHERLFDEFARGHDVLATGLGLGLYVARGLAEANRGSLTYRRDRSGATVMTLRLLSA